MAEGFPSTLCVGDEVGIETFGMLRIAKVSKVTSLTITVDGGNVYSRNNGILRGEAKYRRHTSFLRSAQEVKNDIAYRDAKDNFNSVKKAANSILTDMYIDTDKERLKKQCEEIRKYLLEMEEINTANFRPR